MSFRLVSLRRIKTETISFLSVEGCRLTSRKLILLFKTFLASERFYLLNMSYPGHASIFNIFFVDRQTTRLGQADKQKFFALINSMSWFYPSVSPTTDSFPLLAECRWWAIWWRFSKWTRRRCSNRCCGPEYKRRETVFNRACWKADI